MSQKCFPPNLPPWVPDPNPDPVGRIADWLTRKLAELIIGKKRKDDNDD